MIDAAPTAVPPASSTGLPTARTPLPRWAWALVALVGVALLLPLLAATARLPVGDTVLLPGTESGGVRVVVGGPAELSVAVDVRNTGLVPLRVEGAAGDLGPYAVRLGRGGPGGGVPEEEVFAPFVLWPGQQRLVVAHLVLAGDPAPVRIDRLRLATSVLGVDRELAVELPTAVEVRVTG